MLTITVVFLSLTLTVANASAFNLPKLKVTVKVHNIVGNYSNLPAVYADFKNEPRWQVLENVSKQTNYSFNMKKVNLVERVNMSGTYNLAKILNLIFYNYTVRIYPDKKLVKIFKR